MLVEIPDPDVILGIMIAFLGGLFALYLFYKIKSLLEKSNKFNPSDLERLNFYEKQLIDMKIRLDSLEINKSQSKIMDNEPEAKQAQNYLDLPSQKTVGVSNDRQNAVKKPKIDHGNTIDFVLGLITDKEMTSRDIQIASRRSREHTSRLMNKLFKEGYVKRNTKTKPYTYSITDKGKAKLGILQYLQDSAA